MSAEDEWIVAIRSLGSGKAQGGRSQILTELFDYYWYRPIRLVITEYQELRVLSCLLGTALGTSHDSTRKLKLRDLSSLKSQGVKFPEEKPGVSEESHAK